jgi:organic hydroperoxide reductase OsmC/OhrA
MITYPLTFAAKTESRPGINADWRSDASGQVCCVAVPPEFEGPGGGMSPEDLFNLALCNCFVATFKVFCEKSKVAFKKLGVESRLVVDLDESGKPVMKEFYLNARIEGPSHLDRVRMLAEKAAKSGFILNSVKTHCHFEINVAN